MLDKIPWEIPKNKELQEYLKPTIHCNIDHPEVKKTAEKLIKGVENQKEAAIKIFYFVRDSIKWTPWQNFKKADEVLREGYGACFNKATLQITLLRCVGIPARYRHQMFSKELFSRAVPEGFIRDIIFNELHPVNPITTFAEVYLNGRWIAAATTMDRFLNPAKAREWDGETDVFFLEKEEIIEEVGTEAELHKPEVEEYRRRADAISPVFRFVLEEAVKVYLDFLRYRRTFEEELNNWVKKVKEMYTTKV